MTDPAATSPQPDERPRPRYGEYAPDGWVSPVPQEDAAASAPPAPAATAPVPPAPAPQQAPTSAGDYDWGTPTGAPRRPREQGGGKPRTADVVISVLLLGWGLIAGPLATMATAFTTPATQSLAALGGSDLVELYSSIGLETEGVMIHFGNSWAILAGLAVGLWLGAAWLTVRRLRVRRIAFWVPIVAGAVFFVVQLVVLGAVIAASPDMVERLTTTPGA
jgi:hypothetical protein